eukprot:239825-Prymnesium_polylepis.1
MGWGGGGYGVCARDGARCYAEMREDATRVQQCKVRGSSVCRYAGGCGPVCVRECLVRDLCDVACCCGSGGHV